MIDKDSVKRFWDGRAKTYQELPFESIANLEQDPDNLNLKIRLESEKVFSWLGNVDGRSVLDLGAGVGQWSFRFAARGASIVTAVEYSEALAQIGRKEARNQGIDDVEFLVSPAEAFVAKRKYDIVFISGLFVYLNDDQVDELIGNLPKATNEDTIILLRDGTGLERRHVIDNKLSTHLGTHYSAVYRTRDEYKKIFENMGYALEQDENMFDEGVPLNKYPETRLRVYRFISVL